uniref:Uncharacterized protein n=1 Tax=Callorhinchus milii TaxID=7868 RepID=A0A4W3HZ96_CALMI
EGEKQAGRDVVLGFGHHRPEEDDGRAHEEPERPDGQAGHLGAGGRPSPAAGHRVHQGEVTVDADHRQQVDAAEQVHVDDRAHRLAQELAEGPVVAVDDVGRPEGQAANEEEVGGRQVSQVDLGHRTADPVQHQHQQHKGVAHHPDCADQHDVDGLRHVHPPQERGAGAGLRRVDGHGGRVGHVARREGERP